MKLCFLGNMDDVHTPRWIDFFRRKHGVEAWHINGPKDALAIISEVRAYKPDILHAHYAGWAGLIGALANVHPYIITVHGSDVLINKDCWYKRPFLKWMLNKADLITTDARHVKDAVCGLGVHPLKVKIVRFGVDVEEFKPYPDQKVKYPCVINRKGIGKIYDPETFRKACAIVRDNVKDFYWTTEYETHPTAMPIFLNRHWICTSTALSDAGLSATTAEAMACGLPVLITDVAENREWVKPGFLFKPGNYRELAQKIIWLLGDEKLRAKEGAYNRKVIERDNNYHVEMAKMEQIYKEIA